MEGEQNQLVWADRVKVFVSVEGVSETWSVEVPGAEPVAGLRSLLSQKYARPDLEDMSATVEDQETSAAAEDTMVKLFHGAKRGRLHLHRCEAVAVTVEYNGKAHTRSFRPATTAHRVFIWAVGRDAFNLESEAHDLELQIPGATSSVPPNTHIGTIATNCALRLLFVPKDRPQG